MVSATTAATLANTIRNVSGMRPHATPPMVDELYRALLELALIRT